MRPLRPVERQWIFHSETLQNTPSRAHGITYEDELKRRKVGIEYMKSLAARAGLGHDDTHQTAAKGVLTVAATLLHRFYMRRSLRDFPEKLIAPTILFLASKIEEEPLKLRYIINSFLAKFEPYAQTWNPSNDRDQQQGPEYRHWEKEVLATEEVVLETLCFDMGVEQSWVILRRCIRGLDDLWLPEEEEGAESSRQAEERGIRNGNAHENGSGQTLKYASNGKGKGKETFSEEMISELGWVILSEAHLSPLTVLHHPIILAYTAVLLVFALINQIPLSEAHKISAEIAWKFDLDITLHLDDTSPVIRGSDLEDVERCIKEFLEWCESGLIDPKLLPFVMPEPTEPPSAKPYKRTFKPQDPEVTIHAAEPVSTEIITIATVPEVESSSEIPNAEDEEPINRASSPIVNDDVDDDDGGSLFGGGDDDDDGGTAIGEPQEKVISPPRYDDPVEEEGSGEKRPLEVESERAEKRVKID